MSTTATVVVNETDVTHLAVEGSVTKRLNNVGQASARFQMKDLANTLGEPVRAGMLMKIYFENSILGSTPVLFHHGRIMLTETTADEDNGYVVVNSADPLELWRWRPVRDPGGEAIFVSSCGTFSPVNDPGDFSKPRIIKDFITGPEIVEAMMFATQNIALGADDAEGPLFLTNGTFACNGVDLTGAPVDWPMTMMELASLLTSTGALDIVCQPTELDIDGNYGELSAYNGDYGLDLTSSVAFQYGMGAFNVRALRWNTDMTNMANKLWYFLGPKCDDQHWQANITADADFSECSCCEPTCTTPCNSIRDAIIALQGTDAGTPTSGTLPGDSRGNYGVRMDIKIFDAVGDQTDCVQAGGVVGYCLYKNLWLREAFLRVAPQTLIHVTPARDTEIGSFDYGDLVLVEAHADVNGGFSGGQRVYSYTIGWDAEDSVPAIGELQVSSDQENFA